MIHLGDITKISGYDVPTVDVITGGSPCQDLSVAGKRAGLAGERSGLFMEQMRIVKEMREKDVQDTGRTGFLVRPRYMVWENVPGAFSSGNPKGADFQAVLEEIVRVVCKEAPTVPIPKDGWPKAGCISGVGDSGCAFSIAWRVHDAQFWGVPQRRKRIALVADFGGLSAPEILFERKGLSRDSEPCGAAREETAGAAGGGAESAISIQGNTIDRAAKQNGSGISENVAHTLNSVDRHGVLCLNDQGGSVMGVSEDVTGALWAQEHGHQPVVAFKRGNGDVEVAPTMTGDHQNRVTDYTAIVTSSGLDVAGTLDANYYKGCGERQGVEREVVVCVGNGQLNQMSSTYQSVTGALSPGAHPGSYNGQDAYNDMLIARCFQNTGQGWWNESDVGATIRTPCGGDSVKANLVSNAASIVRRLTPLECERLQGYPDGWTDIGEWTDSKGKKHKDADSPRYKALGNSIALPFWQYLARRICAQYERNITMASLFDGIGGFPLVFERCGAKAVWASEIEEFPIAVTKKHFPEEGET